MGSAWLTWLKFYNPWRRRSLGERGEDAAARFLRRLGYKIVARQARDTLGEIDIIAVDGRTIVFVEVRTRADSEHGTPLDTVDRDKQRRLTRLAVAYLKRHRLLGHSARFDVIGIIWPAGAQQPQIEHIQNAFPASGFDGMFS